VGFHLKGTKLLEKEKVKIKVNELEGPPEDTELCGGAHIVSLQPLK